MPDPMINDPYSNYADHYYQELSQVGETGLLTALVKARLAARLRQQVPSLPPDDQEARAILSQTHQLGITETILKRR